MSAPNFLVTSFGTIVFPIDLDILRPLPSKTNPCERTALYGATPFTATEVVIDELNQPRYWSEPSR